MNALMFFLFIITVASICYLLGYQVGYLGGKAEVSYIARGEPPDESVDHELKACGRYGQKG